MTSLPSGPGPTDARGTGAFANPAHGPGLASTEAGAGDRAAARQLWRAFFDTVDTSFNVALLDDRGRILAVNGGWRRFAEQNGYGGTSFGVGESYFDHCADSDVRGRCGRDLAAGLSDVLAGTAELFECEYLCEMPDGDHWFRMQVVPLAADGLSGAAVSHFDVTETVRAEQAAEAAAAASQAKSLLVSGVSHELRTPLNAIIGFSELLGRGIAGPLGERQAEYLDYVTESAHDLLALINDLLDLAKAEAGRTEVHEEMVHLDGLLAKCVRIAGGASATCAIEIDVEGMDGTPAVRVDPRLMQQILVNLLSNAFKYTPAGGRISIAARRGPTDDLRLTVHNTGRAMSARDVERALTPFCRGSDRTTQAREGTGLGLPLACRFAEAHGGSLTILGTPGRGTAATLILPAYRVVDGTG